MTISIISFTEGGQRLSVKLRKRLAETAGQGASERERVFLYTRCSVSLEEIRQVPDLQAWVGEQFASHRALVFIGASGIAVRSIAPFVRDKLTDSPVLVLDEGGAYVIPLLSGHVGGANRLAEKLAACLGAVPVLTTATDVNHRFAADVFAAEHGFSVQNREGIREVSSRILKGESVTVAAEGMDAGQCESLLARLCGELPAELVPVDGETEEPVGIYIAEQPRGRGREALLWLKPRKYVLGMGCKRGKTAEELSRFVEAELFKCGISAEEICALASIDRKRDEEGLVELADRLRVPFLIYSKKQLAGAEGAFQGSAFVASQVGVDNVCERAARVCAGGEAQMVLGKTARDGMTLAVAERDWRSETFQTGTIREQGVEDMTERKTEPGERRHPIFVVGMGPGAEEQMTVQAIRVLESCDTIVGYPVYLKLLGERFAGKEFLSTPMRQEVERCRMCFAEAEKGKRVAMVCSGDAGIYGMASLMYELLQELPGARERFALSVIPGITAASSGAALLGAPLNHDFCVISLSDLLTPWEQIERRLRAAAEGDFAMAIYNPSSHKRADYLMRACKILLETLSPETACGYVTNIGREGTAVEVCSLEELQHRKVDMFTTVFIGNSQSEIQDGKLITKRGYRI